MEVSTRVDAETATIRVAGELDVLSVDRLVPVLDALLHGTQRRWILDFSGLRIIDGRGVGAINYGFRRLRESRGVMTIEGATAQPLSMLRLVRLDRVLAPATRPAP
jgi:stage II sporulation protein AA (anti-sigma F factor antagonist)